MINRIKNQMKRVIKILLQKSGYVVISKKYLESKKANAFKDQKVLINSENELVVFDVGAHYGETALKYNQLFENAMIYSFEPYKESYCILKKNVEPYMNIKVFNTALGDKNDKVKFHINKFSGTNSILPTHHLGSKIWGEELLDTLEVINVESVTIDDFMERNGIQKIDILKIDTQGTEYDVIKGASNSISKGAIKTIYMEIITMPTYQDQKHFDEILQFLRIKGFRLFNIYNYSHSKEGYLRQVDAIFLYSPDNLIG